MYLNVRVHGKAFLTSDVKLQQSFNKNHMLISQGTKNKHEKKLYRAEKIENLQKHTTENQTCAMAEIRGLGAGGKPSTWLPPERLVELLFQKSKLYFHFGMLFS